MEKTEKTLKVLVQKNQRPEFNNNDIVLGPNLNYEDLDDCALFFNQTFEEVFGTKMNKAKRRNKRLPLVKISLGSYSIHRRYKYYPLENLKAEDVALTLSSIHQLSTEIVEDVVGQKATITKGCWIPYYWFHPFHATRISFRIGFFALLLTVLSLFITIFLTRVN